MEMNVAEYLLPGVSSLDQLLFVVCLIVVVTLDVITKHCVGQKPINKRETRRCGMDIGPVVTLTAVHELRNLSSIPRRRRALLEKIAKATTCIHHRTQAPRIAEKWLAEAKALEETILMILSKQPKREYIDEECKHADDKKCKYAADKLKCTADEYEYDDDEDDDECEYTDGDDDDDDDAAYWAIA
ncbi:hypothetical protein D0860_05170 [Hortaea werneckii]|uniref:Uncharacterized protein n=1 Tax=Hortaea werneckii TaxID=91943 RepID=A0A3M7H247_HORWE|nr:hypothetical protein KC351_g6198 [Hortaea werneckii]RMZ07343.1 hypothetical protein D0860_05170 [Hortaea werneckii]